jgi:hypothetical protein
MDLATHGGPTPTRLPGALSIAINAGRESFCTATDQRHFARADASCDIGAVELGATPSTGAVFANGFEKSDDTGPTTRGPDPVDL